jgi:hypothetical protein
MWALLKKVFQKRSVSADEATAEVLRGLIPTCPACNRAVQKHRYKLAATLSVESSDQPDVGLLLAHVRRHEWQSVRQFRTWNGVTPNIEVFIFDCTADEGAFAAMILSPFSLDEPYILMHFEILEIQELLEFDQKALWHTI